MADKNNTLVFKWTVSRGRDTYGYNICSLWINRRKVASCDGGGYDMLATSLALWLQKEYQDRLLPLADRANYHYIVDAKGKYESRDERKHKADLYGMSAEWHNRKAVKVSLDGGCGWSSITRIANEIGIEIGFIHESRNEQIYTATDTRSA